MTNNQATSKSKLMNIVLWTLQVMFAFYFVAGGFYMISNYKMLASAWALDTFPQPFWTIFGALQMLFAIGLVLPGVVKLPKLTSISATCMAVMSLFGTLLYVAYTGSGILWALIPAILLAFVAYSRWH